LPSLQLAPLALGGFDAHMPVVLSHVPWTWHWSGVGQTRGLVPVHTPDKQLSICVHALPSLQREPLALDRFGAQVPVVVLHVPWMWHWSAAGQMTGMAPVHTPAWQLSIWVHPLPSLHAEPLSFGGFVGHVPVAVSQVAWT
jgi:hypothetical protein